MGPVKKNASQKPFQVNLLIHKGDQPPFYAKLIKWLLSSGRFIVVFVEMITIGAFVMRYKLDAELIDLQEKIKEQVPYIQSLKNDEISIRQTQFQLATIKQTRDTSPDFTLAISQIAKLVPTNIKLSTISLEQDQASGQSALTLSGVTPSNIELSVFIKALQKNSTFTDISLTNISFEGQTVFTITGNLAKKGGSSS